ncbi:hypothetical protein [Halovivax limisalsi]|uniref:hypothetical protein n=1 Tax=Halovivax limisalsi TaxID=1453760 RepID=UPI001FFC93F5|nr:hypothetical protein [Halovivax limisalsi]
MGCDSAAVDRRRLLGGVATVAAGSVAGCSDLVNWIGDQVLGDVNVFNETTNRLDGSIVITAPSGESALDTTFDLPPGGENGDGSTASTDEDGASVFEDVWTDAGTYDVRVALADGHEVDGESAASVSATIEKPDDEMLAVVIGAADVEDPIAFATGTEMTDFQNNLLE